MDQSKAGTRRPGDVEVDAGARELRRLARVAALLRVAAAHDRRHDARRARDPGTHRTCSETTPRRVRRVLCGDVVLLRSSYRGNVRWCWPHRFVGRWDGRLGIYCQPGNEGKLIKREVGKGYLEYWVTDAPAFDAVWQHNHVLRFMRPGDMHTIELFWDEEWQFRGWYVNLQAPLVVRDGRFDTTDWALDVVVSPDGSWEWKDEDDFAQALALGVFDDETAGRVRAEGEAVVAQRPWPTGWEGWRPPGDWLPLPLPRDWNVV